MNIDKQLNAHTLSQLEKISGQALSLGNFLWAIRKGAEISQVAFAETLGISKQCLCDLEHGRRTLNPQQAAKFATLLGYPISQFVRLAIQDELNRYHLPLHVEVFTEEERRAA